MKLSFSVPKVVLSTSIFLVVFLTLSLVFMDGFVQKLDILAYNPNPFLRHFAPTWRSLKKIIDLPYIVWGTFSQSDVPVYEITLTRNDRDNLLKYLPNFPHQNRLYEEFKNTVKVGFQAGSYKTVNAKARYRGKTPNHWNALKKSWDINLSPTELLDGKRDIRLFIPEDRGWVEPFFWNHIREKFGLVTLETKPIKLLVNKRDMGFYVSIEGWEEEFLIRNKRQPGDVFSDLNVDTRETGTDLLEPEGAFRWYSRFDITGKTGESYPALMYLLTLARNAPPSIFDAEIENILDMDIFLRWTSVAVLSGNFHSGNNDENMNFYFNQATGKFEPISVDANVTPLAEERINLEHNRLANRILQNPVYHKKFEAILASYVQNKKNLEDDLIFYDEWAEKIRPLIYQDTVKLATSYEALETIQRARSTYENNFTKLREIFKTNGRLSYIFSSEEYSSYNGEEFASFRAANLSRSQFLKENHQFTAGKDPRSIILLPGQYAFLKNIIIPKNLELTIREGVKISLAPGASFISYSTTQSLGQKTSPIIVQSLSPTEPFGVFALLNTGKNTFRHTTFINGKDATINGIYFSGSLSAHNSSIDFEYGGVEHARADDGIHVLHGEAKIRNARFTDNFSDSIDIDFAEGNSLFEKNYFTVSPEFKKNANGDAIDISSSEMEVRDNIVNRCSDKGISVGEKSRTVITNNIIIHCSFGVAVKDSSIATITQNWLLENSIGLALYRKKPEFILGGDATVSKSILWGNEKDVAYDKHSKISLADSTVRENIVWRNEIEVIVVDKQITDNPTQEPLRGTHISHARPNFASLLPKEILREISQ